MEKKECSLQLMDLIIEQMCEAPTGVAEQYIINNFITFKNEKHTPQEKYDFINAVGNLVIIKKRNWLGKKIYVGPIDSFVKELCSLDKHYLRPE